MAMPATVPPWRPLGLAPDVFAGDGVVWLGRVVGVMVEAAGVMLEMVVKVVKDPVEPLEGVWILVDWEDMILCRPRAPSG
jgi:hypothetical protein